MLEHYFFSHHMELKPAMESCNPQALIHAVGCGLGISFLPERWAAQPAGEGAVAVREMEGDDFVRENYAVWHENKFLTKAMQAFLDIVKG